MTGSEWFGAVPGGLGRYFTDLHGALLDVPGISLSAAAFGPPDRTVAGTRSWGPVSGSTLHRARTAFRARDALHPGTVVDRHFCLYGPAARDRRGRRLPLVVHFHGPWAAESRMHGQHSAAVFAKYLIERLRYVCADRFVVLSDHFRTVLCDDYRIAPDRVEVIAPGVDLSRFRAAPVPAAPPVVLCVRRLERRMGIDVLLRAWPGVLAEHPEARLVIVGTGSAEADLRRGAIEGGLDGSVEFTGRIPDQELAARYTSATLTVVPTVALEGFGLIALESLAAGRAPVVTRCGGLPDAVRGLDPSLIVPPGDPTSLAARISAAIAGARPSPAQCRAHAESFSWQVAALRHAALYRELT
ncbi:glycosyltransferase family 4 protein [Nocardia beijingensis]|uniref:glycosyltransferase family 4 protein n=1 Tax=Nocardia beijingensis TaxID=95162 RepID=UPI001894E848|nr:glycosyltransferase family 4 protein [Nocardia beijingensis]MBF6465517.1 glycosyltransferase family 4 protein [Nocardia beijingensis]